MEFARNEWTAIPRRVLVTRGHCGEGLYGLKNRDGMPAST
jgi:hypothetical protein